MRHYYIWVEIQANKNRILDEKVFTKKLKKCKKVGFEGIILGVKDTSGFGIYNSKIVPHYSKLEKEFEEKKDYLKKYIEIAHDLNLKIYAAIDVFSEGRTNDYSSLSPGFKYENWQTEIYGLDKNGKNKIVPISKTEEIRSVNAIDDFNDLFVNPIRNDVQNYELKIINELISNYDLDGFCLDRVRFIGLSADFSNYSRKKFEDYIGTKVDNWPEDIYILKDNNKSNSKELKIKYGPLFGEWLTFRANKIKSFITKVRNLIDNTNKEIEFLDYTGSWYPIYYQVGANWASSNYQAEEYPWVNQNYNDTGYAEELDVLLSGFYYSDVTIKEAEKNDKDDYWYSVEGAGEIASKVTKDKVPIIGSLFVAQYKNNPKKFKEAIEMCFKVSKGCMIFDLSYVDDYDWWKYCKIENKDDFK